MGKKGKKNGFKLGFAVHPNRLRKWTSGKVNPKRYYLAVFIDPYTPRLIANEFKTAEEALELLVLEGLDVADKYTIIKGSKALLYNIPIVTSESATKLYNMGLPFRLRRDRVVVTEDYDGVEDYRKKWFKAHSQKRKEYKEFCRERGIKIEL